MTDGHLSDEDAAHGRKDVYVLECIPPVRQLVFAMVLFVAATLMSDIVLAPAVGGELGDIEPVAALAGLAGSFLFMMRLHLYERMTRDLVAAVALLVEGAVIASIGTLAFTCWAIAAAWSVLMRVEFFAARWLAARVATRVILRMVVMGLAFAALLAVGINARGGEATVAELLLEPLTLQAMLWATLIAIGIEWGRAFERLHAVHGERAWTWWMLWPSLGAIGFTLLARDAYPLVAEMGLITVTAATIVTHALVMGQRDREHGSKPTGKLREIVELLPGAAGLFVYVCLATGGIWDLVAGA